MAVLADQDRADMAADGMRDARLGTLTGMLKADWRAAIDAADNWVNSNMNSYNNALPTAAKNNLTTAQKALVLIFVVTKRFLTGV